MPTKEFQFLGFSGNDCLHTIRKLNGEWYRFGDFRTATRNFPPIASQISAAGINDELHICVHGGVNSIFHAIRFGNGAWTTFTDIGQSANFQGQLGYVSCAEITGELHVITNAPNGPRLLHAIRRKDGSWTKFGDVLKQAGGIETGILSYKCASVGGELHICLIDENQAMWHIIRHKDGSWAQIVRLSDLIEFPVKPYHFSCAGVNNELHLCMTDFMGVTVLWHAIRHRDGSWTKFGDVNAEAGYHGNILGVACTEAQGELHVIISTTDFAKVWHTIRFQNGVWQAFGNLQYAVTGQSNYRQFSQVSCAGVDQGTYQPPVNTNPGSMPGSNECFPGVPGASTIHVYNGSEDIVILWSEDQMTGAVKLVEELGRGDLVTVNLTNCRYTKFIAVIPTEVDDYNQRFGFNYDPRGWEAANTVNFQHWWSTILGRSNGGVYTFSIT